MAKAWRPVEHPSSAPATAFRPVTFAAFRAQLKQTAIKPGTHRHVIQFGARVGYWPCLKAPFIAFYAGKYSLYLWHGLPSYEAA